MVDSFVVQPKRGDAYKTTDFTKTLGNLFSNGIFLGQLNDFDIIDTDALTIKISTGRALIAGCFVELDTLSDVKVLADDDVSFIFLELTTNASQRVTGAQITINLTDIAPANSTKIGEVTTASGDITALANIRTEPALATSGAANAIFGDGIDGDLTISTTTTETQTRYYNRVVIQSGGKLTSNDPMLIFVKDALIIESGGSCDMNGKGGAGGTAGTVGPAGGGAGGVGVGGNGGVGATAAGTGGAGLSGVTGIAGVTAASAGGKGGDGNQGVGPSGAAGGVGGLAPGAGGPAAAGGTFDRRFHNAFDWLAATDGAGPSPAPVSTRLTAPGAGGGGGGASGRGGGGGGGGRGTPPSSPGGSGGAGGAGGAAGGAGGAGGGTMVIFAKRIDVQTGGNLESVGLAGANGASNPGASANGSSGNPGNAGGGGGGGASADGGAGGTGGNGGLCWLIFGSLIEDGDISVAGGAVGNGGASPGASHGTGGIQGTPNAPPAGQDGTDAGGVPGTGVAGQQGTAGAAGQLIKQLI